MQRRFSCYRLAQPQILRMDFMINVMRVQKESAFFDALIQNYGKLPNDGSTTVWGHSERIKERNQASISPHGDAINQQKISNDLELAKLARFPQNSLEKLPTHLVERIEISWQNGLVLDQN
ncbi:unnamed protein product [Citrullus colocynthis]|uniref:Uncharacterized protein n=1 Tax=Citrullus colocynthis TaxID=252529 RepID=A0ABP0Y4R7_9ROSI